MYSVEGFMPTIIQKLCAVCKQGSHRTDWINVSADKTKVACDHHTVEELAKVGITKVEPASLPAATSETKAGAATAKPLSPAKPVVVPATPATPAVADTTKV